jgi:hypothetical protein
MLGMDIDKALEEKLELIIATVIELKDEDEVLTEETLTPLLVDTYNKILPPIAKVMVKSDTFTNAALKRSSEILKAVNKSARMKKFTIV